MLHGKPMTVTGAWEDGVLQCCLEISEAVPRFFKKKEEESMRIRTEQRKRLLLQVTKG